MIWLHNKAERAAEAEETVFAGLQLYLEPVAALKALLAAVPEAWRGDDLTVQELRERYAELSDLADVVAAQVVYQEHELIEGGRSSDRIWGLNRLRVRMDQAASTACFLSVSIYCRRQLEAFTSIRHRGSWGAADVFELRDQALELITWKNEWEAIGNG